MDKHDELYILHAPSGQVILRPRVQPLLDTFIVSKSGKSKETLFIDHRKFPTGVPKRHDIDTNMRIDGCLGAPLMFHAFYWLVVFEGSSPKKDIIAVLDSMVLTLFMGQHNQISSVSGSTLLPVMVVQGINPENRANLHDVPNAASTPKTKYFFEKSFKKLAAYSKRGLWRHYTQRLRPDNKPVVIDSTTLFFVEAEVACKKPLKSDVVVRVMLNGVLFTGI